MLPSVFSEFALLLIISAAAGALLLGCATKHVLAESQCDVLVISEIRRLQDYHSDA